MNRRNQSAGQDPAKEANRLPSNVLGLELTVVCPPEKMALSRPGDLTKCGVDSLSAIMADEGVCGVFKLAKSNDEMVAALIDDGGG